MADIQNFDFRFAKKESNAQYQNLINCVGIKPPYYNSGFKQKYIQSKGEQGDNDEFFITKRLGFKKLKLYNNDGTGYQEEVEDEWINGMGYDVCVVGGFRYFLYFNKDETKIRIYKQTGVEKGLTENSTHEPISKGFITNITRYEGKTYFPGNKKLSKRFLLTSYVRGKHVDSGTGKGIITRKGDTLFSSLSREDREIKGSEGDYVRTSTGIVHIIGRKNIKMFNDNGIVFATSRAKVIEIEGDVSIKQGIEYKIFNDYGLTFHFVTSDGLIHWHYDEGVEGSMDYTICTNTYFNTGFNEVEAPYYIEAITNINEGTVFLNSKGFLFVSGIGLDKFFYSGLNIIQTTGEYTNINQFMSNVLLSGPNKLGYLTYDFTRNVGEIFELVKDGGMYGKYSLGQQDDKLLYVRNSKDFYQLKLTYGYGASKPAIEMGYLSQFLNSDFESLQEGINDINISIVGNNTYIFISDGGGNTKVLLYDMYYMLRFKRYVTGLNIIGNKHGCFYGGGIMSYEGNTDNGNSITQIISGMFGNLTQNVTKKIEYIKSVFGYNTYCNSKNSVFNAYLYDLGYEYNISYSLNNKGGYVDNLFHIKYDSDNFIRQEFMLSNKPIGIEIHNCEGVFVDAQDNTLTSEFNDYNNLGIFETKLSQGNKWNISKVGFMKFPIGQPCNVIVFELIAREDNKIEFGGFSVGFQYYDYDGSRIEDIANKKL